MPKLLQAIRGGWRKGFTLAELLIVVAIIAVLSVTSILVLSTSLEKSREATDIANLRNAKAAATAKYLEDDENAGTYYYDAQKGVLVDSITGIAPYGKGTAKLGGSERFSLGGGAYYEASSVVAGKIVSVSFNRAGDFTLAWVSSDGTGAPEVPEEPEPQEPQDPQAQDPELTETILAGTYMFNADVSPLASAWYNSSYGTDYAGPDIDVSADMAFTSYYSSTPLTRMSTAGSAVSFSSGSGDAEVYDGNDWSDGRHRMVTLAEDASVSHEFYTWFEENTFTTIAEQWTIKSNPSLSSAAYNGKAYVDFTCDGGNQSYVGFEIKDTSGYDDYLDEYVDRYELRYYTGVSSYVVAATQTNSDAVVWESSNYRIIDITGGEDSTPNASSYWHIVWLENNSTDLPIVDLTGTTWTFHEEPAPYDADTTRSVYINFTSDGRSYTSMTLTTTAKVMYQPNDAFDYYGRVHTNSAYSEPDWGTINDMNYTFTPNQALRTITIIGGADATNEEFIWWMLNNAELGGVINLALNPMAVIPAGGTYTVASTSEVLTAGDTFPELANNDTYEYGDYKYTYWIINNPSFEGWDVAINTNVTDRNQTSYGAMLESINGMQVKRMFHQQGFSSVGTFAGCASLTTIPTIPSGVTSMAYAFNGCASLTDSELNNLAIPSSVTSMRNTFAGCAGLTDLSGFAVPGNVTDVYRMFYNCTSLAVPPVISDGIRSMNNMFFGCTGLTDLGDYVIPDSVTTMQYAFSGCSSLTVAPAIPSGVSSIERTFEDCTSLTTLPDLSNANSLVNMSMTFAGCTGLTNLNGFVIPSGVTDAGDIFRQCTGLVNASGLIIADSVSALDYAFWGCTSLVYAPEIPSGVENLNYVFYNCKKLASAPVIPNSVTQMAAAFSGCTDLVGQNVEIPHNCDMNGSTSGLGDDSGTFYNGPTWTRRPEEIAMNSGGTGN